MSNYTLVVCHFGDPRWISGTLRRVDNLTGSELVEVVVVDQSRTSRDLLTSLPRVSSVLTPPLDIEQIEVLGHDHPSALNHALHGYHFRSDRVLVLDSDCYPLASGWLQHQAAAEVAADPAKSGLSHPCYMNLPVDSIGLIDFAEGVLETGVDTGRLVALQLARAGIEVSLLTPTSAFNGFRGHFYLGGMIYHHGSASFAAHPDARIASQTNPRRDERLATWAEADRYSVPMAIRALWATQDGMRLTGARFLGGGHKWREH